VWDSRCREYALRKIVIVVVSIHAQSQSKFAVNPLWHTARSDSPLPGKDRRSHRRENGDMAITHQQFDESESEPSGT